MNSTHTSLYDSAANYFNGPEGMRNEVAMWFVAAGLVAQELSRRSGHAPFGGLKEAVGYLNARLKKVNLLDLCSGPGTLANHLSLLLPGIQVTCVDVNENFVEYGIAALPKFKFIHGNAVSTSLGKTFDVVTASSGYHHIEDKDKVRFLENIKRHLLSDGLAVLCENFLPRYRDPSERVDAVKKHYDALEYWFRQGNAADKALQVIGDVRQQELAGDGEYKVSLDIFQDHVQSAGLKIETDTIVWQPDNLRGDGSGSHVVTLRKAHL